MICCIQIMDENVNFKDFEVYTNGKDFGVVTPLSLPDERRYVQDGTGVTTWRGGALNLRRGALSHHWLGTCTPLDCCQILVDK